MAGGLRRIDRDATSLQRGSRFQPVESLSRIGGLGAPVLTQSAYFRPHNKSSEIPGLYIGSAAGRIRRRAFPRVINFRARSDECRFGGSRFRLTRVMTPTDDSAHPTDVITRTVDRFDGGFLLATDPIFRVSMW